MKLKCIHPLPQFSEPAGHLRFAETAQGYTPRLAVPFSHFTQTASMAFAAVRKYLIY
jgi:hypothetical protein